MEIFNRILGIDKIKSSAEMRGQDMLEFWEGFQSFRKVNLELERDAIRVFGKAFRKENKRDPHPFESLKAGETFMIFLYGVHKTKELYTCLTDRVPVPDMRINRKSDTFYESYISDGLEVTDSWLGMGVTALLEADGNFSTQVGQWRANDTNTVSDYLPDWAVVDTFIAGAEEYAHELYVRLKPLKTVTKKQQIGEKIDEQANKADAKKRFFTGSTIYHTQDMEYRALLWQYKLLKTHLPNWAGPTKDFIEKVRGVRIAQRI